MKLIRFGDPGQEKPGVLLQDGTRVDASDLTSDFDEDFLGNGGLKELESWVQKNATSVRRVSPSLRLGPPIRRPSKIVCIGLNYRDHAAETKAEPPKKSVRVGKECRSRRSPRHQRKKKGKIGENACEDRARQRSECEAGNSGRAARHRSWRESRR